MVLKSVWTTLISLNAWEEDAELFGGVRQEFETCLWKHMVSWLVQQLTQKPKEGWQGHLCFTAYHLKRSFRFHFTQLQVVSSAFLLVASFAATSPGTSTFFLPKVPGVVV